VLVPGDAAPEPARRPVLDPEQHGPPAVGWLGTEPVAPGAAELGQERCRAKAVDLAR
jgi:hypothetical protein